MSVDNKAFEKVTIFISASELGKIGMLGGLPDVFAVIYTVDPVKNQVVPVGFTEILKDNLNPSWTTVIVTTYHFEAIQEMILKVYHHDGKHNVKDTSKHTLCGECRFILSNLICAPSSRMNIQLTAPGNPSAGNVSLLAEPVHNARDKFVVDFYANNLSNKEGFFATSDPFLKISRLNEDGSWTAVWQNNKIDNTLKPRWNTTKIDIAILCNGDLDRPIRIEVFDHEKSGKHVFMGMVETSVRTMLSSNGAPADIIEPEKQQTKKGYTNSGTLHAANAYMEENPTFADFVTGGCEISMVVAIDFTGSNGDPSMPGTLHYLNPTGQLNLYEQAISSVGKVLEPYDTDKMYPVYGFGAKIRQPDGSFSTVQHCFPVYGGGLEVQGVDGILKAYRDAISNVALSGPTLFGPLISAATSFAAAANCSQEKQNYVILLILTDGVVNDLEATKAAIIAASDHPISVVAVGVGSADFTGMNALDSDNKLLSAGGKTASRDILQFVPQRDFLKSGPSFLAQHVLAEIPQQLLLYMKQHAIKPNGKK